MLYETKFIISLLLTIAIETPVLLFFLRVVFKNKIPFNRIILAGFLASALTLPYLWFILPSYISSNNYILIGEIIVILIEMIFYSFFLNLNLKKSFLISLSANVISYFLGLFIVPNLY